MNSQQLPTSKAASIKRIIWMIWGLLMLANGFVFAVGLGLYCWISARDMSQVKNDEALVNAVDGAIEMTRVIAGIAVLNIACLCVGAYLARKLSFATKPAA